MVVDPQKTWNFVCLWGLHLSFYCLTCFREKFVAGFSSSKTFRYQKTLPSNISSFQMYLIKCQSVVTSWSWIKKFCTSNHKWIALCRLFMVFSTWLSTDKKNPFECLLTCCQTANNQISPVTVPMHVKMNTKPKIGRICVYIVSDIQVVIVLYCLTKISIRSSVNFPADFVCLWNPVPF